MVHVLGYEHSFVNQVAEIMSVPGGEDPVAPRADFTAALKVQRALAAVVESDQKRVPSFDMILQTTTRDIP